MLCSRWATAQGAQTGSISLKLGGDRALAKKDFPGANSQTFID
jgi:hypothetical protein